VAKAPQQVLHSQQVVATVLVACLLMWGLYLWMQQTLRLPQV